MGPKLETVLIAAIEVATVAFTDQKSWSGRRFTSRCNGSWTHRATTRRTSTCWSR